PPRVEVDPPPAPNLGEAHCRVTHDSVPVVASHASEPPRSRPTPGPARYRCRLNPPARSRRARRLPCDLTSPGRRSGIGHPFVTPFHRRAGRLPLSPGLEPSSGASAFPTTRPYSFVSHDYPSIFKGR